MVTGTLQVFHLYTSALLDPRALFFFVSPYIAVDFGVSPKM